MKTINGIPQEQTLDFLQLYANAPLHILIWGRHYICNFIFLAYARKRYRIMTDEDKAKFQKDVWQFLAYWYDKLGYQLPVDANHNSLLFNHCKDEPFAKKVEERKIFVNKILKELLPEGSFMYSSNLQIA